MRHRDVPLKTLTQPREATNEAEMHAVLSLLYRAVTEGAVDDARVVEAVRQVALSVPEDGPFHERDVRDRLWAKLEKLYAPASGGHVYEGVEQRLGQRAAFGRGERPEQ